MTTGDPYGVILGRSRVEYQDGSEDEVLSVIESLTDRSVDSAEWAAHIRDWPTRYHFSAQRSNLLRPLSFGGLKVLEIGCGTGPLTRHLGESGAEVLAVDGSLARARAAATRCADLPSVRVMCGTIDDVDERDFDVVSIIGVLEYAGAPPQAERPDDWLRTCLDRLAPGGTLVLAVENQLGLKYLLGWDEDHHGMPWVGVRGYLDVSGARTWSRRELGALFDRCGLAAQRWFFPFPDYKLPTVVLDQGAYRRSDGPDVVDALVVHPTSDDAGEAHLTVDARDAHRVMLDAGLGEDVANSFLVVASTDEAGVERLTARDTLAWLSGDGRSTTWRRRRRVVRRADDALVVVTDGDLAERRRDWLVQRSEAERPFADGEPLDRRLTKAFSRPGTSEVEAVLRTWLDAVPSIPADAVPVAGGGSHPLAPAEGEAAVPASCVDLKLSNFVVSPDGSVRYIDDEWSAVGPLSRDLALFRGLWWTAKDLVDDFVPVPWGFSIGVHRLTVELGILVGLDLASSELLDRFLDAEAALQALVHDVDPAGVREALGAMVDASAGDVTDVRRPLEALSTGVKAQQAEIVALQAALGQVQAERAADVELARRELAEVREVLHNTEREVEALRNTKLFRWAQVPRRAWSSVRSRL